MATRGGRDGGEARGVARLTYHALRLFADDEDAIREVTEAKLALTTLGVRGRGDGVPRRRTATWRSARAMRDTRLGPIGGGTDEVMKEILAKQLGL